MNPKNLDDLRKQLRAFAAARDWGQFHSPKNLSMALSAEAGELLEHFQWLSEAQSENLSPEAKSLVAQEIADLQIYLVSLADRLDVDILEAVGRKLAINEQKYPVEKARGSAEKYTRFQDETPGK